MIMAALTIKLEKGTDKQLITIQKLDPWPNPDGYERYELKAAGIECVISLDADYWAKPCLVTPEDAEDYYEKIHYPSQRPFFSDNNAFTNAELRTIANQIAHADQ
jgi:hypothetical protein